MAANGGVDRNRILANGGGISDHLRNHIHLTNCIHLKNHLHNLQTPFPAAHTDLLTDLVSLQKSRPFRDPSQTTTTTNTRSMHRTGECTRRQGSITNILQNGVPSHVGSSVSKRFDLRGGTEADEEEANAKVHGKSMNKERKRNRFRSRRRNRPCLDAKTQPQISAASNTFLHENGDQNCTSTVPANKCGIPWNWSRIHHRGKSFLPRSLSESRSKKEGAISENSSSCSIFGKEAFPLLLDASGSQGSIDRFPWIHDCSGELNNIDSDLASRGERVQRQHQNLTQKYMPRTFNDLVGQNLVVQALSNAVRRRKIGFLYVFHGPHGTGKTACARIFARALNCQSSDSSKPCGFCDSCIAHEKGRSRSVREIGPVHSIDYEGVLELFESRVASSSSSYGVFIFDECDAMSSDCWSALLKVIYSAPRHVVIILVCSNLDALPHVIVSRCQKFCFNKLKDADIVCALQLIASKEDIDIDGDALKLVASRSDGSLRDAEMTLEQLSLLGQKISLCLVQELVGLISEEKLLDLLDFALSSDTINTVKNLRDIMASGVEPLALMSQLATVITDILAGSYDNAKERPKRKFFNHQALSKEEMEKLRQALRKLSEAEKQLRVSSERMTWLMAAMLQLAPHQRYTGPISSATASSSHSPAVGLDSALKSNGEINAEGDNASKMNEICVATDKLHRGIEEIWVEVLENIKIKSLKEFMQKEGKMASMNYGEAPTVQLVFNSQLTKSVVEKFRSRILEAFEAVLGTPVTIEIRQGSRRDTTGTAPILLRGSEMCESKRETSKLNGNVFVVDERELSERKHSLSIVRRRASLAHVIHHEHGGSSKHETLSTADHKLEQENLRLESRSRILLCWTPPCMTHPKLSCLKITRRKSQSIRKFVCCGRSLSARTTK